VLSGVRVLYSGGPTAAERDAGHRRWPGLQREAEATSRPAAGPAQFFKQLEELVEGITADRQAASVSRLAQAEGPLLGNPRQRPPLRSDRKCLHEVRDGVAFGGGPGRKTCARRGFLETDGRG